MTWNTQRDKEQESNVQTISEVLQRMEVPVSVGWFAPKKLEATDRKGIEKEIHTGMAVRSSGKYVPYHH